MVLFNNLFLFFFAKFWPEVAEWYVSDLAGWFPARGSSLFLFWQCGVLCLASVLLRTQFHVANLHFAKHVWASKGESFPFGQGFH